MTSPRKLLMHADVRRLTTYVLALWKLFRHPDTPRPAKWLAGLVLAYALSPIDLIPDFIPVLGQLDDLILLPLGIALVSRLVPASHWQACLTAAAHSSERLPRTRWGLLVVVLSWLLVLGLCGWALFAWLAHGA